MGLAKVSWGQDPVATLPVLTAHFDRVDPPLQNPIH